MEASYKKLHVWKAADELVNYIYEISIHLSKEEIYGLSSQLRRAALSVPANIVEGHARNNKNEFRHFITIALGSLAEVEYYLEFSYNRKYLTSEEFQNVTNLRALCGKQLWGLFKSLRKDIA